MYQALALATVNAKLSIGIRKHQFPFSKHACRMYRLAWTGKSLEQVNFHARSFKWLHNKPSIHSVAIDIEHVLAYFRKKNLIATNKYPLH